MVTESNASTITTLKTKLFEAEDRRLGAIITSFNRRNKQLTDAKVDGFLYLGQVYLPKDVSVIRSVGKATVPLHPSLASEMEAFLVDQKQVRDEQHLIGQILVTLLRPCRRLEDIRDALPECLISCLPQLQGITRDQQPAWTLIHNPRAMRQYEKFLPKMEVYSAAKLIY